MCNVAERCLRHSKKSVVCFGVFESEYTLRGFSHIYFRFRYSWKN